MIQPNTKPEVELVFIDASGNKIECDPALLLTVLHAALAYTEADLRMSGLRTHSIAAFNSVAG